MVGHGAPATAGAEGGGTALRCSQERMSAGASTAPNSRLPTAGHRAFAGHTARPGRAAACRPGGTPTAVSGVHLAVCANLPSSSFFEQPRVALRCGAGGCRCRVGAMGFNLFSVTVPLQPPLPPEPHRDLLGDPVKNHLPRSGSTYGTELQEIK